MADPTRDILAAALSLPEGERLRIVSELLASVQEPYDDAWKAAWLEELERREQAVRDGAAGGTRGPRSGRGCSRDWALVDLADRRWCRRPGRDGRGCRFPSVVCALSAKCRSAAGSGGSGRPRECLEDRSG
ncbi:addiction module protein [Sorangium sp. So ce394]|uniref:addiction module protein n=1 Tax=Sorangium sp. So ce394 TaxID=3133310 RepID=UPI003F5C863F